MGEDRHVGPRLSRAQEDKGGLPVGLEVAARIAVVPTAGEDLAGAGQIPSLLAGGGEAKAGPARGVEDVLLGAATHDLRGPVGQDEVDRVGWRPQRSGVVEAGVLGVGSLARGAPAEVAGGPDHAVALLGEQLDEPGLVLDLLLEDPGGHVVGTGVLAEGDVADLRPGPDRAPLGLKE